MPTGDPMEWISRCISEKTVWVIRMVSKENGKHLCKSKEMMPVLKKNNNNICYYWTDNK